jgi:hypothetical protein
MSAEIANEIWSELKRYVSPVDRADAADGLVAVLIDNDFNAADIRAAFKGDDDVRAALQTYIDDDESEEEYDEDRDEDEY